MLKKFLARFGKKPAPQFIGYQDADGFVFYEEHPTASKAENVRQALDDYEQAVDRGEPFETVATDFLSDLFHLIASEGEDPEALVSRAFTHFETEFNATAVFV